MLVSIMTERWQRINRACKFPLTWEKTEGAVKLTFNIYMLQTQAICRNIVRELVMQGRLLSALSQDPTSLKEGGFSGEPGVRRTTGRLEEGQSICYGRRVREPQETSTHACAIAWQRPGRWLRGQWAGTWCAISGRASFRLLKKSLCAIYITIA